MKQLSLLEAQSAADLFVAHVRSYVRQGQERPADIAGLEESAATMEARVLGWFASYAAPQTPSMCAEGMGRKLTTVRPRICQLARRVDGPRLQRLSWLPRRPTEDGSSEGWYRYIEGGAE